MSYKETYERIKNELLNNKKINPKNRILFKQILEHQEYRLKRIRGLSALDEKNYKTLVAYICRLKTVNIWFKNKPWKGLTVKEIKKVYDDLEDGKIVSKRGTKYDTKTYYKHIIRSTPFKMAGQEENVKEAMAFYTSQRKEDVRFITEEMFRKLVASAIQKHHKLFFWLCFDIGENATSILQLRKRDCMRQYNKGTKEPEYLINLRKDILKRTRKERSEITNYKETVELLDEYLKDKEDDDLLFDFGPRQADKIMQRAVKVSNTKVIPKGDNATMKDLRSSMACDLLNKGWTCDEINARLGHSPSSRELDKYVNFLATNKGSAKKKISQFQVEKITDELDEIKNREKVKDKRHANELEALKEEIEFVKAASANSQEVFMALLKGYKLDGEDGKISYKKDGKKYTREEVRKAINW